MAETRGNRTHQSMLATKVSGLLPPALLLVLVGCAGTRGSTQVEQPGPPPPVVMDTTVWTQFGGTSWYFNWSTLYRARGDYDYGVWVRLVHDEPGTVIDPNPVAAAVGSRFFDVRMVDTLMEYRCDNRERIERATTLRLSNSDVLVSLSVAAAPGYATPGTVGAAIVDVVCARGRAMG